MAPAEEEFPTMAANQRDDSLRPWPQYAAFNQLLRERGELLPADELHDYLMVVSGLIADLSEARRNLMALLDLAEHGERV